LTTDYIAFINNIPHEDGFGILRRDDDKTILNISESWENEYEIEL